MRRRAFSRLLAGIGRGIDVDFDGAGRNLGGACRQEDEAGNKEDGDDDEYADACWAMLAVAAPASIAVDVSAGRIAGFIDRDASAGKKRSSLLVGALTGLGRIDETAAGRLNGRYRLRLERRSSWTGMIDGAAARGQGGTVAVLAGIGLEGRGIETMPATHMFHAVAAFQRTGHHFVARMIAAEALSPAS